MFVCVYTRARRISCDYICIYTYSVLSEANKTNTAAHWFRRATRRMYTNTHTHTHTTDGPTRFVHNNMLLVKHSANTLCVCVCVCVCVYIYRDDDDDEDYEGREGERTTSGGGVQPCKLIRTDGHTNWKYLVPSPKAVRYARSALMISRRVYVYTYYELRMYTPSSSCAPPRVYYIQFRFHSFPEMQRVRLYTFICVCVCVCVYERISSFFVHKLTNECIFFSSANAVPVYINYVYTLFLLAFVVFPFIIILCVFYYFLIFFYSN